MQSNQVSDDSIPSQCYRFYHSLVGVACFTEPHTKNWGVQLGPNYGLIFVPLDSRAIPHRATSGPSARCGPRTSSTCTCGPKPYHPSIRPPNASVRTFRDTASSCDNLERVGCVVLCPRALRGDDGCRPRERARRPPASPTIRIESSYAAYSTCGRPQWRRPRPYRRLHPQRFCRRSRRSTTTRNMTTSRTSLH